MKKHKQEINEIKHVQNAYIQLNNFGSTSLQAIS